MRNPGSSTQRTDTLQRLVIKFKQPLSIISFIPPGTICLAGILAVSGNRLFIYPLLCNTIAPAIAAVTSTLLATYYDKQYKTLQLFNFILAPIGLICGLILYMLSTSNFSF